MWGVLEVWVGGWAGRGGCEVTTAVKIDTPRRAARPCMLAPGCAAHPPRPAYAPAGPRPHLRLKLRHAGHRAEPAGHHKACAGRPRRRGSRDEGQQRRGRPGAQAVAEPCTHPQSMPPPRRLHPSSPPNPPLPPPPRLTVPSTHPQRCPPPQCPAPAASGSLPAAPLSPLSRRGTL